MTSVRSYKNYVNNKTLTFSDLLEANKNAENDMRWCNAFHQKYLKKADFGMFGKTKSHSSICRECTNTINLAKTQIKDKKITLEQFLEDPSIIIKEKENIIGTATRKCNTCEIEKLLDEFHIAKHVCKACRLIESQTRNNNITPYLEDIEQMKSNIVKLEQYVKKIPKDPLNKIASHYKVGRLSSDTKDKVIVKFVSYFQRLLDPWLCTGGCGYRLEEQFQCCEKCKRVREKKKIPLSEFIEKVIPTLIDTLEVIDPSKDDHIYNKDEVYNIGRALGIRVRNEYNKAQLVALVNTELKKRTEERNKKKTQIEVKDAKLELNGIIIQSREDGFINATQLCKAGSKTFSNWKKLEHTELLITELESVLLIGRTKLISTIQGGSSKLQGTWIHPDLAVQLAQWISPKFAIQVSRWIRELAFFGSVSTKSEKTDKQLLDANKKLIEEQLKRKEYETKYNKLLKKRNYHKFKIGAVFYIISDLESGVKKLKPGFEGVDINIRLQQHRSSFPACKLEYLLYSSDSHLIEQSILKRFEKCRKFLNHEWCYDVELKELIASVETVVKFLDISCTVEENIQQYNKDIEEILEEGDEDLEVI
jgi:hypothetical protein